jgi:hypothetical protein
MAATQAEAKVHPAITHFKAFFTTLSVRFHIVNLVEMCTLSQCLSPLRCSTKTSYWSCSERQRTLSINGQPRLRY